MRSKAAPVMSNAIGKWISTTCCACFANRVLFRSKGWTLMGRLLDHDGCGHLRMDGAEIRIGSGLREGEGKLFVGIEDLGLEDAVRADDGVRDVVVIDPGNRGTWSDCDRGRAKAEIVDLHVRSHCLLRIC